MTPVRYPEMRNNLRAAATDLSDETFHAEAWADPRQPTPNKRFSFQEAVAYVVDDLDVPNPNTLVEDVLADDGELTDFEDLRKTLNALLLRIGSTGTYAAATATPEWARVRSAARKLADALARSDAG